MQVTETESAELKVQLSAEANQGRSTRESLVQVQAELQEATGRAVSAEAEAEVLKTDLREAKAKALHDLEVGSLSHVTHWLAVIGSWMQRHVYACLQSVGLVVVGA